MLKKGRGGTNSQTLKKFQQFMKKRLQKKNILQSNESINKKIQCFQELLKLTKSGETLVHHSNKDTYQPVSRSYKNISVDRRQECEVQENTDLVLGKLDRMVHDVNGWIGSKKASQHQSADRKYRPNQKKEINSTPSEEQKFKKFDYKSAKVSRIKYGTHIQEFVTEDVPMIEERPGYAPNRRKQYMTRHNSSRNLLKNKNATSKTIDISSKTPDFSNLKNQITQYENKAKEIYGLTFQLVKSKQLPQETDDLFSMKEESKEIMRVISLNQFKKTAQNPYRLMVDEHTRQDSSVPAHFLGMIRSSSAKTRKKMTLTTTGSRYIRV